MFSKTYIPQSQYEVLELRSCVWRDEDVLHWTVRKSLMYGEMDNYDE